MHTELQENVLFQNVEKEKRSWRMELAGCVRKTPFSQEIRRDAISLTVISTSSLRMTEVAQDVSHIPELLQIFSVVKDQPAQARSSPIEDLVNSALHT